MTLPPSEYRSSIIGAPNVKLDIRKPGSHDHQFLFTIFVLFRLQNALIETPYMEGTTEDELRDTTGVAGTTIGVNNVRGCESGITPV